MVGVPQPVGPVGDIGQGAHARQPLGQHVHLALHMVQASELAGNPVLRHATVAGGQVAEHRAAKTYVLVQRRLAEVRGLGDLPQPAQAAAIRTEAALQVGIHGQLAQGGFVQALL